MQRRSWSSLRGLEGPAGPGHRAGIVLAQPALSLAPADVSRSVDTASCFPRIPAGAARQVVSPGTARDGVTHFRFSCWSWDSGAASMAHLHPPEQRHLRDLGGQAAPWDARVVLGSPVLFWFGFSARTALAPRSPLPSDPNTRICSSSTPAPALILDTWNASSWGPQTGWESPEEGAEPGELFSRSHFIIVAKETSSQDLAWNMSASAGPHIHLSQSALRAGAGADKGGDGGGGCSGTTAAALNRPARAGHAARKSCQGS